MSFPSPGSAVRGSSSGRPIMALLDLLGRRWCLRILWELQSSPASFRELQGRCAGLSPSVLNTRLNELREACLLENGEQGYQLSSQGQALIGLCLPLAEWAEQWADILPMAPKN
jgi:DNA-binding HxlR family transcriptional regulator